MKLNRLADPNFQSALQKLTTQEIPLSAAFKLKGIIKRADEELSKYEDVRKAALEKLGERDEAGNLVLNEDGNVKFVPEKLQAFIGELNTLLMTDIEIGTIRVEELGTKLTLSVNDLLTLSDIILD